MKTAFWLFGTELSILMDEKDSERRYDLVLGHLAPGVETPLHLHTNYSETIYVTEGEFTVFIQNKTTVLLPGDHIHIASGIPHVVANTGISTGKALTVASPSGFAELIRTVGIEGQAPGVPVEQGNDMGLFVQLSERIGDVLIGPPGSRP